MTSAPTIRTLTPNDRSAWEPLWQGYQSFYKVSLDPTVTDAAWRRFHDPAEPVFAIGALLDGAMVGIAHYIFHRSTWAEAPYCYLNDLFTTPEARGRGVGHALITAVYAAAQQQGADRVYWLTHETNAEAMILYNKVADRTGFLQYRKALG